MRVKSGIRLAVMLALGLALMPGLAPTCSAGPVSAVFTLGPASINGNLASFDVSLDFSADPNVKLVFFGLDVSSSSAALTGGGTDYSAFSFTPKSPMLDDWYLVTDFGGVANPAAVQYDTVTAPLGSGVYALGTLVLDLGIAGVIPAPSLIVSIEGPDTMIGAEDPQIPSSFDFYAGTFRVGNQPLEVTAIPEPASWHLSAIAIAAMLPFAARLRRRHETVSMR